MMLFKKQTKTQKRIANKFLNNVDLGLINISPVPHLSFSPVPTVHRNRFNPHLHWILQIGGAEGV